MDLNKDHFRVAVDDMLEVRWFGKGQFWITWKQRKTNYRSLSSCSCANGAVTNDRTKKTKRKLLGRMRPHHILYSIISSHLWTHYWCLAYSINVLTEEEPYTIAQSIKRVATGLGPGFDFQMRQETSRSTLGSSQPHVQSAMGRISQGIRRPDRVAGHSFHVVSTLRMRGNLSPLHRTFSWMVLRWR